MHFFDRRECILIFYFSIIKLSTSEAIDDKSAAKRNLISQQLQNFLKCKEISQQTPKNDTSDSCNVWNYARNATEEENAVDGSLLERLSDLISKLDVSPYGDAQTTIVFERCIEDVLSQPEPDDGQLYCPRTFDLWSCWNDTPAGSYAFVPCPTHVFGFGPERFAFKTCLEDGTWFKHPETNKTWSNYTTCIDQEDLLFRQKINTLYITGYSISVIALVISLAIFFTFKSLKCTRITIHKNLFISFIINNVMWIVWYTCVVNKPKVLVKNEFGCQALHVLVHFFLLCNYFWMFCEGLYLHTLLVIAFVSEEKILKWFYIIGWGVPLIFIGLYAGFRNSSEEDTILCWIDDSKYSWWLYGPVCVSFALNLVFLINIVRLLVTKLRAVNSPDTHQTRKAVRATLILIPLLGLHYMVTPFRPQPGSPGEAVYEVISGLLTALQGFCVAMLFCFCNGEVTHAVKTFVSQKMLMRSKHPKFRSRSLQTTIV